MIFFASIVYLCSLLAMHFNGVNGLRVLRLLINDRDDDDYQAGIKLLKRTGRPSLGVERPGDVTVDLTTVCRFA